MTFGAILTLALAAACGGGTAATGTPGAASATPPAAASATPPAAAAVVCDATGDGEFVSIADFSFNPSSTTVAADGFVTWRNNDGTSHTVTFDAGPNCGNLSGEESVTVQFTAAGSYPYHCNIHPDMTGTVEVS
jgi:plastocyanin